MLWILRKLKNEGVVIYVLLGPKYLSLQPRSTSSFAQDNTHKSLKKSQRQTTLDIYLSSLSPDEYIQNLYYQTSLHLSKQTHSFTFQFCYHGETVQLWNKSAAVTEKEVDPHSMSTVQNWSANFITFGMKSNIFKMEFLPLASKSRTPQSRMRNRRGPEKESFIKVFEGKKIQEHHWNSWVLTSNFHHTLPASQGISCSFNHVSLLPAAPHPPAAGAGTGLQCWGETATGPRGVKDALQPWRPKNLPEHPQKGLWQYCSAVQAEMGALACRNPGGLGFLLYLHIPKLHRKVV